MDFKGRQAVNVFDLGIWDVWNLAISAKQLEICEIFQKFLTHFTDKNLSAVTV